jgi:hypothetical protein
MPQWSQAQKWDKAEQITDKSGKFLHSSNFVNSSGFLKAVVIILWYMIPGTWVEYELNMNFLLGPKKLFQKRSEICEFYNTGHIKIS